MYNKTFGQFIVYDFVKTHSFFAFKTSSEPVLIVALVLLVLVVCKRLYFSKKCENKILQ